MIGNRILLHWKEPRHAYRHFSKQINWKHRARSLAKYAGKWLAAGLLLTAALVVFRGRFNAEDLKLILAFSALFVFLGIFIWFASLLMTIITPEISLREKDIMITSEIGITIISYKEIESCRIIKTKIDETEFDVLEFKGGRGGNELFAVEIAENIKNEDIIDILRDRNIPVNRELPF